MMPVLNFTTVALIGFCVATETAREVCFKQSARCHDGLVVFLNPVTAVGILFWFVELLAWSCVLESAPLSLAFPLMASSYVAIALAGVVIFKETINLRHALGIALVCAGVVCVGMTGL